MTKKTVFSYCMSASLLVATTGCTTVKEETTQETAKSSDIQMAQKSEKTLKSPEESTSQPQDQKNMNKRVTTPSGLMYEIIEETQKSDAKKPSTGNIVTVHYTGWLADANGNPLYDKKFDSSRDRNQTFQFSIGKGQVIKGWDEGVMDMKVGEKRRLIIPAGLAYGNRAVGNIIPANSTLVFDVELIDTK